MSNRIFLATAGFAFLIILLVTILIDGPRGDSAIVIQNIVTPLMTACFLGAGFTTYLDNKHDETQGKLNQIEKQTNGILDGKIRQALADVLLANNDTEIARQQIADAAEGTDNAGS